MTDEIEDKARKIGEDLGITIDEAPDFEIEDDDSIAKSRTVSADGKPERPKLTSKEKRDLRKSRWEKKLQQKDEEILALRTGYDAVIHKLNQVDSRFSQQDKQKVEKAYEDTAIFYRTAEQKHADAFERGDGKAATEAMREMYQAQRQLENLDIMRKSAPAASSTPQIDQRSANYAKNWAEKNTWFKNDDSDDNQIANTIAVKLTNEGFNPATEAYWNELDNRLVKFIPDKVKREELHDDDDFDDGDDEYEPLPSPVRKPAAPPVGSSSSRGEVAGKRKVTIPAEFRKNLEDAGIWGDPVRRNRAISGYLAIQKNNS